MRKFFGLLLAVILPLVAFVSCERELEQEEDKGTPVDITMEEIVHANSTAALLEIYDNFLIKYTYADGTKDVRYVDDDMIFVDAEKYEVIYTEQTCIFQKDGVYTARLFAGVPQDLSWSEWLTVDEEDTRSEIIKEAYMKDGKIHVTSTLPRQCYETDLQDASLIKEVEATYLLDADTYVILASDTIYKYTSGKIDTVHFDLKGNAEEPVMLTQMKAHINAGSDVRDLTVVLDPDTEQEAAYTITLPKDGFVEFYYPADYGEPYIDRACTVLMTDELDTVEDLTVYIKKEGLPEIII